MTSEPRCASGVGLSAGRQGLSAASGGLTPSQEPRSPSQEPTWLFRGAFVTWLPDGGAAVGRSLACLLGAPGRLPHDGSTRKPQYSLGCHSHRPCSVPCVRFVLSLRSVCPVGQQRARSPWSPVRLRLPQLLAGQTALTPVPQVGRCRLPAELWLRGSSCMLTLSSVTLLTTTSPQGRSFLPRKANKRELHTLSKFHPLCFWLLSKESRLLPSFCRDINTALPQRWWQWLTSTEPPSSLPTLCGSSPTSPTLRVGPIIVPFYRWENSLGEAVTCSKSCKE